jgi:hypothetical protein
MEDVPHLIFSHFLISKSKSMKNYAIHSGNFSAKGNFTGYTALGEKLFIHKSQMNGLGWTKADDVKFPFYSIGAVRQIGQLDENGKPAVNTDGTPVLNDRLQALSVFATKEALTSAHVDTATLDIEIKQAVSAQAKSAGLSESAIQSLLSVAI